MLARNATTGDIMRRRNEMILYTLKKISCKKQECVFMDHFGKDIDESKETLGICLLCHHAVIENTD